MQLYNILYVSIPHYFQDISLLWVMRILFNMQRMKIQHEV